MRVSRGMPGIVATDQHPKGVGSLRQNDYDA